MMSGMVLYPNIIAIYKSSQPMLYTYNFARFVIKIFYNFIFSNYQIPKQQNK